MVKVSVMSGKWAHKVIVGISESEEKPAEKGKGMDY